MRYQISRIMNRTAVKTAKNLKSRLSKGFTLIEILIAVLIVGILIAIVYPNYEVSIKKAQLSKYVALVRSISDAEERHFLATNEYTPKFEDLDIGVPVFMDGCSLKKQNSGWYYDCNKNGKLVARYGLFNNVSNAQAGDSTIRYLSVFKNYKDNGVSFKKGDKACFSKKENILGKNVEIARKACKSLGSGTEYKGNGWDYIYIFH